MNSVETILRILIFSQAGMCTSCSLTMLGGGREHSSSSALWSQGQQLKLYSAVIVLDGFARLLANTSVMNTFKVVYAML